MIEAGPPGYRVSEPEVNAADVVMDETSMPEVAADAELEKVPDAVKTGEALVERDIESVEESVLFTEAGIPELEVTVGDFARVVERLDEDIEFEGLAIMKELFAEIDDETELEEIDDDGDGVNTILVEEVGVCKLELGDDERDEASELEVSDEIDET